MKKLIKLILTLVLIAGVFQAGRIWSDVCYLREKLIRLHVVADSDSAEDQSLKLQVKDAINAYLMPLTQQYTNTEEVLSFLEEHLDTIKVIAENALHQAGSEDKVRVSLGEETFDTREYETFSLPAGIYKSLRVVIGSGEGQNWWCVAFPSLCMGADTQEFTEVAASAGLDDGLTASLANDGSYEIRFYLMDCIGKIENLF